MKKSLHLIVFFISMAMLESAVVIYLRELLYPDGFHFPLVGMKPIVIATELAREAATIIMLWTVGYIAGRNFSTRFAWFLIGFGIWDIFYYIFLYVFIQWPASLFEWDILFLIPLPWYGPVIAPCIISILMIILGWFLLYRDDSNEIIQGKLVSSILMGLGCVVVLWTFMGDFVRMLPRSSNKPFDILVIEHSQDFIPLDYSYMDFAIGVVLIICGMVFMLGNRRFYKD
ncbi:MAG: hypothetical protein JNL75_07275 [Chitinophagales bacterium]|nr:hypothetical protein [Chitinophagales bacterium]